MTRRLEDIAGLGLILLVCTLTFGVHLWRLGFYWDDYASIYVYLKHGHSVFTDWFGGQARPLGGLLSGFIWNAFGVDPLPWQVIDFALYVASVLLFWRILRVLFPDYPAQMLLIALLFAVYPSYHIRPIVVSFSLIASLVVMLGSFWLSLLAVKRRRLLWAVLAAALIPVYQLIYEQNIGYEALRPLAMAYVLMGSSLLSPEKWRSQRRIFLGLWLPLLVAALGVIFWRFVLFEPNETYGLYNQPIYLESLSGLILTFKLSLAAPVKMLLVDWVQVPYRLFVLDGVDTDLPFFLALVCLLGCLAYSWRYASDRQPPSRLAWTAVLVSFPMMGVLLLSVHVVGRQLENGVNSRWALTPSLLAALVIGLGVPRLLRSALLGQLVLVVLVVVGAAVQVGINQEYADDWTLQREVWWQIKWRAPQLHPDSLVVVVIPPKYLALGRQLNDYEVTTLTNFYYPDEAYPRVAGGDAAAVAGLYYGQGARQGNWSEVLSGRRTIFRDWVFDLDHLLVFGYDGGCLQTADPAALNQTMTDAIFTYLALLHQPRQIAETAWEQAAFEPDSKLLGEEPPHTWCFYYQRIQWATQMGLVEEATRLTDEAIQYVPPSGHSVEWIPLIEAYNRAGRYAEAEALIYKAAIYEPHARLVLCERLNRLLADGSDPAAIQQQIAHVPGCRA